MNTGRRDRSRGARLLLCFLLSLGAVLAVVPAYAQVATTGSVQVVLEDQNQGRLPGVTVTASAPDVVTTRTAVTDGAGIATLEALAPSADYKIEATLPGFRTFTQERVLVRSGQVTTLHVSMGLSTLSEAVNVTADTTPTVDVTRAIAGEDITLQLTESLPTGRSYQSYLQLVPGVMPDSQISPGNPASRSGVNFKENSATADNIGGSTDNRYYFEGINVTDPYTGTFGANLNTEIIQEQKVITGGIPAEYVGAAGLISTVITKSGSNAYSGSYNYFFRNDGFVAKNDHTTSTAAFNNKDTAFTIGGPVLKDKLWGFGSFRYTNRVEDVTAADTLQFLREAETTGKQGFAKGTWVPTQADSLTFTFLNDPQTRSADTDGSVANSRIRQREQGGNNYLLSYTRVFSNVLIDGGYNQHDAAISDFAAVTDKSRNTVAFQTGQVRTLAEEQLGGFGQNFPETRPTKQAKGSASFQWKRHNFKTGLEWARHEDHRDLQYTGPDKAQYTSITNRFLSSGGVTAGNISTGAGWSTRQFRTSTASDFNGLIATINTLPNRAAFYTAYDTDRNGTITPAEMNDSLIFSSTAGNPDSQINYYRIIQTAPGPQDTRVQGLQFFGQDEFRMKDLTLNVGLRGEHWGHYATTGDKVFQFDWNIAPRLSLAYDVKGDGRQKASVYWGRYYDPVRMDMTNFAGTATGQSRDEQVFINNQWVTYRTRGGPTTIDGFFSPTTKTPYTDELQLQYEADLGRGMSVSAVYYNRKTRDIFEDFDPGLYTEPSVYGGDINDPNTLFLGWDYFGWTAANHPAANFFLGTLPDGERNYNGLELSFRKRFSDGWQLFGSYAYLDATGNAISDGNADFAGDVLWLDPRAVNMEGVIAGTIKNNFKVGGSYATHFGLELGGTYRWNSGTIVNRTQFASSRRLPEEVTTAYVANGVSDFWVAEGAIGAVQNPSWGQLDVRVQYVHTLKGRLTGEAFLDIFNLTDNQGAVRLQDLTAGSGTTKYLDEFQWLNPRNALIGFRVRF
ncbi:MAG: TonB-dependent receptor [Vicinamibacterales bacterium]|nr:TonB-dependent receptor [Vicinamibacterales bacterium]